MPRQRGPTAKSELRRAEILDATEAILGTEGYPAVSSRRVAAEVGINAPLVHYYFPTLDDLFVGVLERLTTRVLAQVAAIADEPRPLTALWDLANGQAGAAVTVELQAAAQHRPAVREAYAAFAHDSRDAQLALLAEVLPAYDLDPEAVPPDLVLLVLFGLGRLISREELVGITEGHKEAVVALERVIADLEERRRA